MFQPVYNKRALPATRAEGREMKKHIMLKKVVAGILSSAMVLGSMPSALLASSSFEDEFFSAEEFVQVSESFEALPDDAATLEEAAVFAAEE